MQLPFEQLLPKTNWVAPKVSELPSWRDAKRVSFDIETKDPQLKELGIGVRRGGHITGFAFQIEGDRPYYVPIRHEGGGNVENIEAAIQYFRDQAACFSGELVGAHLAYELDYCAEVGIEFSKCTFWDAQLAAPLIYEHHWSYTLDDLLKREGLEGKNETILRQAAELFGIHPKYEMYKLHAKYAGEYAERDVSGPLELRAVQEKYIESENLWRALRLENELLPVTVRMRRRGVKVDMERLHRIELWTLDEQKRCVQEIKHHTGANLSLSDWKKAAALEPIIRGRGIVINRTDTDMPQIDKALFEANKTDPVIQAIRRGREMATMRSSFVESVLRYQVNGRIHASFNQLKRTKDENAPGDDPKGTITGRLSQEDPNLTQQPKLPIWRAIYLPDFGLWCSSDYAQQEPKMLVHFAVKTRCRGAEAAKQAWLGNPRMKFHDRSVELTGLPYDQAKQTFLAKCYGMGTGKYAIRNNLPWEWAEYKGRKYKKGGAEAQAIFNQFDEMVPFLQQLSYKCQDQAKASKYIKGILDERYHFRGDDFKDALNKLLQGSSARQTKLAMVEADRAGFYLQLAVHDEIDASVEDEAEGRRLGDLMENVIKLEVPTVCDVEMGRSWGEIDEKGRKAVKEFDEQRKAVG
jgi:DNA polymerase I-like protein with 3'-5' exonuclease and polymerase domains